jgi:hypothetical protein
MYPWATKEYLLWNMSLGQIIMYMSIGHEQKHGKREASKPTYQGKSHEELSAIREQLRQQYGAIDG